MNKLLFLLKLSPHDKSNPALDRMDMMSLSHMTRCDEYVGSFRMLKQVDAVGKRLSSLQFTRCNVAESDPQTQDWAVARRT
jgi:hypothetical protein